jgi:hypothetical protein
MTIEDGGKRYLARFVAKGERYGREDCLTHDRSEPMIEIYMLANASKPSLDLVKIHGPRGYFVNRWYFVEFVVSPHGVGPGICLHGGGAYDESISIEARTRVAISRWARDLAFPQ